jgi:hypothetical protein
MAKDFPALRGLYPFDPAHVTRDDFISFFEIVFQYIYPGVRGLDSASKFENMLGHYIDAAGVSVHIDGLEGTEPYPVAEQFVLDSIDRGLPVMYLLLRHKDAAFSEYEWHWFTLTGYVREEDGIYVKAATWGREHSLHLGRLWDTGRGRRGGMVRMSPPRAER